MNGHGKNIPRPFLIIKFNISLIFLCVVVRIELNSKKQSAKHIIKEIFSADMNELIKYVLVDIDNTILSQNKRKQVIIKHLFNLDYSLAEINADFSLLKILKDVERKTGLPKEDVLGKFNDVFFSEKFYDKQFLEVIKNSNYYLNKISEKLQIIYLTSRNESLRDITLKNLKDFGFPDGELIMSKNNKQETLSSYDKGQLCYKDNAIKELLSTKEIVFGVGDTISDCISYYTNGVQAVLITTHETEKSVEKELISSCKNITDYDEFGLIGLDSWEEIYEFTLFTMDENNELLEIVERQSQDYTSFLSDLDNKSSMILIIATFCATAFFSAITAKFFGDNLILKITSLLGLFSALLSVFFAIKSFSSKVVHTKDKMGKVIFDAFFKKKSTLPPHLEKQVINKSKFANTATVKFLHKRYDTLNVKAIKNKTLYNMRSANYEKIYPEFQAKICLFFAIGFMFLSALLFVVLL